MRCDDFLQSLDGLNAESLPDSAGTHLAGCSSCAEAWRDWQLLRAGFRAIAEDAVPEAQFGFAVRVARRLENAGESGRAAAEFFERIGRRFVLASLLLVTVLILGMILPDSGPFRGAAFDEPYLAQAEPGPRTDLSPVGYESGEPNTLSNSGGKQIPK
jgi:hypothetical protein